MLLQAMLTPREKVDVENLLTRLNDVPDGQTVVANILRSLEAKIVAEDLAEIVLMAWVERVRAEDTASSLRGKGPISAQTVLAYTESELIATIAGAPAPCPWWDKLRLKPNDPFRVGPRGELSNIKDLATVLDHLLGISLRDPHSTVTTPIPLRVYASRAAMARQKQAIQRALDAVMSPKINARIHHRRWFWLTTRAGIKAAISRIKGDDQARRAIDVLGLVHFSRDIAARDVSRRYIVEVGVDPSMAGECTKPSFIFADHNPRFVAWTDSAARQETLWGNAVDLDHFDQSANLVKGGVELVAATPDTFTFPATQRFRVLGYLETNRWGPNSAAAEGTEVFADRLRFQRTKTDVLQSVMALL